MQKTTLGTILFVILLGLLLLTNPSCQPESATQTAPADDSQTFMPVVARQPEITPTVTLTPTTTEVAPGATSTPATPSPTASATTPAATSTPRPVGSIVVDHTSVELFEQIPEEYLQAAAALNMFFMDRSVGLNIDEGLTCLSYPSDEEAPDGCSRIQHVDPIYEVDPSVVSWSRPGGYDRSNWDFQLWEDGCDSWSDKQQCFFDVVTPVIDQYDVVSFQYSYLAVYQDESLIAQPGGYFWDNANSSDVYDLEAYEAQHPDKEVIYWTTSLARAIGTDISETFNQQMRDYAIANGKPLFDVADILSHTPDGQPCYDNRDGVPYSDGNKSEDHPDDGLNLAAICQQYTTEAEGGHLGRVSAGKIRVAKAFWVLMAQIAGWNP